MQWDLPEIAAHVVSMNLCMVLDCAGDWKWGLAQEQVNILPWEVVCDEQWAHSLHEQPLSGEQEGIDPPPQINLSL